MPFQSMLTASWFKLTILALILVKLAGVAILPDTGFPDRHLYLAYADIILGGSDWLYQMEQSPLPITGFRAIGYPLVLAAAKLVAGPDFGIFIRLLQLGFSVLAAALTFQAMLALCERPWVAAVSTLSFGLSVALAYEVSYLTDSFFLSAWICIAAVSVRAAITGDFKGKTLLWMVAAAVLITSMRGNGIHLLAIASPLFILAVWRSRSAPGARAFFLLAFFAPSVLLYIGISEWNRARTGEAFFTTGAQIALVQPVFEMARRGATPFEGDDPYAVSIRTHAPDLRYDQIYDANRALFVDHGLTAKQIADTNVRHYLSTVFTNPGIFLSMWAGNFDDKFALGLLNPAFGLHEAYQLTTGERLLPGFSKIVKAWDGSLASLLFAVVYGSGMVASVVVFLAAFLGTPVRLWLRRRQHTKPTLLAVGLIWLACLGVLSYYCALFVELRYLIMLYPFITALGFWTILPSKMVKADGQARPV